MKSTEWSKRFLASTRGQIVAMLRRANCTVNDLTAALNLTDNAIRSHLTSLERDGLVQQNGVRRGLRKPHYSYSLTPEAEQLFPKAYGALLNQVLVVLQRRLPPGEKENILREVGEQMAQSYHLTAAGAEPVEPPSLEARLQAGVQALGELGGLATVETHNNRFFIRGGSCPLTAVTADHPEVCLLAETFVAGIVGLSVQQRCNHQGAPQCCFEIMPGA